jgi:hypothetical protein
LAGEDLLTYTGQASIAYQDALNQARNAQNSLLRQYGFTAPSGSDGYSVEGAQAAFNPNDLFDKTTGGLNKDKLSSLVGGLQVGGTGLLSDISRAGASEESAAVEEMRGRGFSGDIGGGLMQQRRNLAEAQTSGRIGSAKNEFIAGIAGAISPIGGAYQNLQNAGIYDQAAIEEANAYKASLSSPVDLTQSNQVASPPPVAGGKYSTKGTPGGNPPAAPKGGSIYKGPGGVSWQYRMNGPNGKGWYK